MGCIGRRMARRIICFCWSIVSSRKAGGMHLCSNCRCLMPSSAIILMASDYDGAWLISTGMPTKPLKAEQFLLIEVKAI